MLHLSPPYVVRTRRAGYAEWFGRLNREQEKEMTQEIGLSVHVSKLTTSVKHL